MAHPLADIDSETHAVGPAAADSVDAAAAGNATNESEVVLNGSLRLNTYRASSEHREWSTVVHISIIPLYFQPVSLSLPRSPLF